METKEVKCPADTKEATPLVETKEVTTVAEAKPVAKVAIPCIYDAVVNMSKDGACSAVVSFIDKDEIVLRDGYSLKFTPRQMPAATVDTVELLLRSEPPPADDPVAKIAQNYPLRFGGGCNNVREFILDLHAAMPGAASRSGGINLEAVRDAIRITEHQISKRVFYTNDLSYWDYIDWLRGRW